MRTFFLMAAVLVAGQAAAQQPQPQPAQPQPQPQPADPTPAPLARAELDKRARKVAYEAVEIGVSLFNGGERSATPQVNYEGTARLYEGTLLALVQMLDHRPDTAKLIQAKLEAARILPKPQDRAFVYREALDEVMKVGAKKIALWDRLGGEKGVTAVVKEFVATTAKNPKVNFDRGGKYKLDAAAVARIEKTLVELVSAVTGGPLKYSGKDLKESHAGMMITEAEFTAMAEDLINTLAKLNVPPAEIKELIAIVASTKPLIVEGKK